MIRRRFINAMATMSPVKSRQFRADELPAKARGIGFAASLLIRCLSLTYRWRLEDRAGVATADPQRSLIWVFWHNRIFVVPKAYRRYLAERRGAVLTSASRDGAVIAATIARFGVAAVRGSSSRRGAAAMLGLIDWLRDGYDVAIVPDGPRGPRYRMGPGAVKLASLTGAAVLPIRIEYGSWWAFRSWDRFRLPKPFTRVTIVFEPLYEVEVDADDEALERHRIALERILNPEHETD